ncbi:hypothetical protein AAG906_013810 [Vitis piasezkii]
MRPVDCIGTFPLVNASRVLQLHKYALFLTLGISEFDVRRVMMGYSPSALENPGRLLSGFNGATITS